MTAPKLPDWILDSLRRDLLVTGSSRPRTLEAGVALYLAEHGMFDAVGGDVVGLQFEVLLARAGVVTEQDVTFVRPGLVEIDWVEPHKQVLLRCELQPKWLRHRYLFVEFPVRATAAR